MARYRLRVHIRVMNRGQWDVLDDLMFSDEVQGLIGDVSSYVDGRSLVIDKTVSYSGFLFINPFFEIIEVIRNNVGECLAIGDYVDQGNRNMSAYVCEIGDLSESETTVSAKLSSTSISDIEAWVNARGKTTPQSAISTIKAFYGAEPQPTMQGPWSIEKEIELRHNVFSKAEFDEIVEIAKANIARIYHIFGGGQQSNQLFISIATLAGQIGAAHGRKANASEKKLFGSFIQGLPDNLLQVLVAGIEEPFDNDKLDAIQKIIDVAPQLCSSILDLSFCFIYADGKVEAKDKTNLQKLAGIFSMPMSAVYMAMQFGEDIPNPPIDYAAYVSGVDNDTVAYMAGSNGFMNVNLGGQNTGIRMVSADLSDDDDTVTISGSDINDAADNFIDECKDELESLNDSWKEFCDDYQESIEGYTFYDEDDFHNELMKLAQAQRSAADDYERLFAKIDQVGEQMVEQGIDSYHIRKIAYLLDDVMEGIEGLSLDYDTHGSFNGTYGSGKVTPSSDMKATARSWKNKKEKVKPAPKKPTPTKTSMANASSAPKAPTPPPKPQVELSNEEIDAKILDLLKNGEKYAAKELRASDDDIDALSPQKLSAALRRMVQNGSLIKVDENGDSYYHSTKALYDKTVKAFNSSQSIEKFEELIKTFNLLGGYEDSKSYADRCREKIKEINYDAANQLMVNAKTPNDFKKAADAFKKLGNYRESESNLKLCTTQKQELENANAYDSAIKKMNEAKSSMELTKVVSLFEALGAYRDSKELAQKCKDRSGELKEEERKQNVYNQAIAKITSSDIAILTQAATELDKISGWRDADIQAHRVRTKISDLLIEEERIRIAKEKKKKKIKIAALIIISVLVVVVVLAILTQYLFIPMHKMNKAEELLANGNYLAAKELYEELDGYSNSGEQIKVIDGLERVKDGDFEEGINAILSNGVPVEITYDLGGGGFSQTQTLMLGYTLSTDPSIVPLSTVENKNALSNENNVFLFTSKSEFDGLYVPHKNGYSFVEYKLENHKYDLGEGNNCVRLTLKAQWKIETYGVTYELDGGKVNKENIIVYNVEDDSISLNAPTRDGYTFVGWIGTDINEPTMNVKIPKGSYGDRHYIATWKANEYIVTFDANQGVCDCLSINVLFDSEVQLPIPTREGYTFIGWYSNSQKFEDGIWKHLENVSLTAEWKITEYSITYHLDGGENASSNPSAFTAYDEVVLKEPKRTGYTFVGWTFDGQTEPTKNVKISLGTKANREYTAHWQANTYHIMFNPNGGSSSTSSMDMIYDANYTLPTPTKTGYTFLGWYDGSTKYASGISKISDNIELLAKWEAKSYTITYNPNGGTLSSTTQTVTYGTAYTLYTPTRVGYTFEGWYSGSSEIVAGTWNKDSGITVTAQWKVITYTITYENTYGTPNSNPLTYTVNDEITLANLTLTGNPFVGWYKNSSYTTPITKISKGTTGNITLYAKFTYAYEPIYNASDLKSIQMGKSYILMNNIDLGGAEWTPLGSNSAPFTGSFNGNGYKISNFKITNSNNRYIGLFGYSKGTITNLGVESFTISNIADESTYAGGLVGYNYGGTISNCYAIGSVSSTIAKIGTTKPNYKTAYAGGLVGYNSGNITDSFANCTVNALADWGYNDSCAAGLVAYNSGSGYQTAAANINRCYAMGVANARATSVRTESYAGGLIAKNAGNVTDCYTTVTVSATITDGYSWDPSYAGGLIASASGGTITNCYATGSVNASSSGGYDGGKSYAGGLIANVGADVTTKNCYATGDVNAYASVSYGKAYVYVGGLYGYTNTSATISNCYRLSSQSITYNSSGVTVSNNTTGTTKTQAQMQTTSFHTSTLGWSTSIWNIISNAYPTLK